MRGKGSLARPGGFWGRLWGRFRAEVPRTARCLECGGEAKDVTTLDFSWAPWMGRKRCKECGFMWEVDGDGGTEYANWLGGKWVPRHVPSGCLMVMESRAA